ncbi:hypothetical protein B0A48_01222 [Cryoendolithus antarcticus]|uniref:FMN hydroxy acid dehydrogenase domain-containing protein n=1 Tax=Cryoendolithus antarcticus TaxID=1507870 RepID=A0A1V8TSK4_9PEZI|nr:hypothetical protein B0A48_01222 [Cryoendolithus antarcticus]
MSGGAPIPVPVSGDRILCIPDLQKAASQKLPTSAREFYNSGSTDQITINENSTAFSKYRLRPRVLVDVSKADTSTALFGRRLEFPLGVSPAGMHAMAHPDGEKATSRACAKAGVAMGISSYANYPIADIRSACLSSSGIPQIDHVIQLYTMKDRAMQLRIIREAEARGCKAIFLTADSPVLGVRYNEWRNDFRTPEGLEFPIIERDTEMIRKVTHDDTFTAFNDDTHNWARDIPWLKSVTGMEIWIKGSHYFPGLHRFLQKLFCYAPRREGLATAISACILTAEDTLMAIETGCHGIIVSNHGGRQLDGVPATIDALPECVAAAAGRIRIHVDGGIRSGTDIFKALALGAECCWVGRPAIWGLAYDGQAGVEIMLETLRIEFKRCMQLTGCNSVKDITLACLGVYRVDGPLARL